MCARTWHFMWHERFCHHSLKAHPSLLVSVSGYYYLVIVEPNTEINRICMYNRNIVSNWDHIWANYSYHTLGRRHAELYRISLLIYSIGTTEPIPPIKLMPFILTHFCKQKCYQYFSSPSLLSCVFSMNLSFFEIPKCTNALGTHSSCLSTYIA